MFQPEGEEEKLLTHYPGYSATPKGRVRDLRTDWTMPPSFQKLSKLGMTELRQIAVEAIKKQRVIAVQEEGEDSDLVSSIDKELEEIKA